MQSEIKNKKMFYIVSRTVLHVSLFYVAVRLQSKQTESGIVNTKLQTGRKGQKTKLTGRSQLRSRRFSLVAITLPRKLFICLLHYVI
jgi:hypothetical protein